VETNIIFHFNSSPNLKPFPMAVSHRHTNRHLVRRPLGFTSHIYPAQTTTSIACDSETQFIELKKMLTSMFLEPQSVSIPGKGTYWGNFVVIKGQQTLIANETVVAWRNWRCDQGETFRMYLQSSLNILLLTFLQLPQRLMKVALRILRLFLLGLGRRQVWMSLLLLSSTRSEMIKERRCCEEKVNSVSSIGVFAHNLHHVIRIHSSPSQVHARLYRIIMLY
jgi:hypothetical protein